MDELISFLMDLIVLSAVFSGTGAINATITVQSNVVVALINDSAILNCSTTSEEVEWADQKSDDYIYSYGKIHPPYENRSSVENYIDSFGNHYNLILQSVTKEDAGRYKCQDSRDLNLEGKEVQLIVLETEPICDSNLNVGGLIGPNSCAIKPETVQLSCSVRFSGHQAPELQWMKNGENVAINSSICAALRNVYTCNLRMEPELQMEGNSYVCQTTQSTTRQYNCISGVVRIIYAFNDHPELRRSVNDKVNCSFNSSSQSCISSWIFVNGTNNWTETQEMEVKFKRPGRYICEAICPVGNNNCTFAAMTVNVTAAEEPQGDDSRTGRIVGGIIGGLVIIIVIILFVVCVCRRKKRKKKGKSISNEQDIVEMEPLASAVNDGDTLSIVRFLGRAEQISAQTEQTVSTNVHHVAAEVSNAQDSLAAEPESMVVLYDREIEASNEHDHSERDLMSGRAEQAEAEVSNAQNSLAAEPESMVVLYDREIGASNEQDHSKGDLMPLSAEQAEGHLRGNILRIIKPMETDNRKKRARGLAILKNELFVVFHESTIIEAVLINSQEPHRIVMVRPTSLVEPGTMAACATNNCLYVIDQIRRTGKKIFRINPDGEVIKVWETNEDDNGRISVNHEGNVIMTVYDKYKMKMYSPEGKLLTTIDLSLIDMKFIFHAINLTDGNFIIAQGSYKSKFQRVCKINETGEAVLSSFGSDEGSDEAHLNSPAYLAERNDGSILVADQENNRIIMLNSDLEFPKELFTKEKDTVSHPGAMCVYEDKEPARLFLSCDDKKYQVLVLRLDQSHD